MKNTIPHLLAPARYLPGTFITHTSVHLLDLHLYLGLHLHLHLYEKMVRVGFEYRMLRRYAKK
jgi:hypothetical protein